MGPNEIKLRQVESAIPGALTGKAIDWDAAKTKLDALRTELVTAQQRARETWTQGSDAEAADAAFTQKLQTIERMQTKLEQTAAGMRAGAEALSTARSDLQNLPEISPAPGASPTRPGADASDADIEAYNTAKSEHDSAASSHATSVERRENDAAAALTRLDAGLAAAQKMLATAAPAVDQTDVDDTSTGSRNPGGSGSGLSGTPVVGGTTAVSAMASAATIGRGPRGTNPTLVAPVKNGSTGDGDGRGGADGDGLTDLDTGLTDGGSSLGQAGGMGAGGVGGAAGAAGLLGAGKGILAKAAGAAKGASSAGAGSGRTAGMAKGSTLGSSSQSTARVANPASQAGQAGARPGAQAGRAGASPSSQAGRAGGSQASRSAPGTGSRAGTRPAQGSGSRAGQGAGGSGRGNGTGPTGRGGNAARSGTGAGGQGRRRDEDDEPTQDHLAFDDDQWLDDDETSPGVLS